MPFVIFSILFLRIYTLKSAERLMRRLRISATTIHHGIRPSFQFTCGPPQAYRQRQQQQNIQKVNSHAFFPLALPLFRNWPSVSHLFRHVLVQLLNLTFSLCSLLFS